MMIDAYRPKPFYFLNRVRDADLTRASIREALDRLKAAGFGGCIVFNKPPHGFSADDYLGERWFQTLRYFAEEAVKTELQLWIHDGFDCPPGDVGGRLAKIAPHLKQQRLKLNATGVVEVVAVPWHFPAFEEPESSRLFIELVYEAHKRQLGEFFGKSITGFFSDADNRRMPHGVLAETYYPWSGNFAGEFEQGFGYSVEPHLPDILNRKPCQAAVDYWLLAGRLYQRWFANNYVWCHQNNLKYSFHSGDSGPFTTEEMIRSSIFSEGDAFEMHAHSDFPGADHELRSLNGGTPLRPDTLWVQERAGWGEAKDCRSPAFSNTHGDVRAKLAGSVAFLNGREGALCELFAATNWSAEPDDLRRIAVWQIMQGITFLVPHAVHHRMGPMKYFAPPEFMRCGALAKAVRLLNDHVARLCVVAAQGELVAPIALLDPTREIWRERKPVPQFFELCDQLNRLPYGYVIAPISAVTDNAKGFRVAVNPGLALSADLRAQIARAGVTLLEDNQLDRLPALIACACSYTGTGRPHFLRRQLKDGETLLVANIEDPAEIIGDVTYAGSRHPVALLPGEVAAFTPSGIECRKPVRILVRQLLAAEAEVAWQAPNGVTLCRWEDARGQLMDRQALSAPNVTLFFRWKNREELADLTLLVPMVAQAALLDGKPLGAATPRLLLSDEEYQALALPGSGLAGDHVLELRFASYEEATYVSWRNPCHLEGDFDCEVEALDGGGAATSEASYYNFFLTLPAAVRVTLRKRRCRLALDRSWAEQGHPFYSGRANYRLAFRIPDGFRHPVLRFPTAHCQLELTVNGRELGCKAFPPYDFDLAGFRGDCQAELLVENTLGNRLDGYGAPSGLAAVPELLDVGS
jgi:hypothetical protein